jgi:hypothetical protein
MIQELEHYSPWGKSDHSVLHFKLMCYIQRKPFKKIKFYYNKADNEYMREEIMAIDWENKLNQNGSNVENNWNTFYNIIKDLEKKYIPNKEITCGKGKGGVTGSHLTKKA